MAKERKEIIIVQDRSGSMRPIASDMEGAIEEIIDKQKAEKKDDVRVTYVRFDSEYEMVFDNIPIDEVDGIQLEPRGMTALLDAIGKTINKVERRWSETKEKDRASKVLFLIITDGGENSSQEFTDRAQIFEMIETVKRDHGWEFSFIGANQDAIGEGGSLGIRAGASINYAASADGVKGLTRAVSNYTASYFDGAEGESLAYSDEDRDLAMGDDK